MKYSQIYHQGPLDAREPLYHSCPFFLEFYGVPEAQSVYGVFIDNPSETFIDVGHSNSQKYMIATTYGDLDYYVFLGDTSEHIVNEYTAIIGKTRLMPRFALGYHQGCYGYEDSQALNDVAMGYRGNNIPLDGLHVDVDIQQDYCTFTMNEANFPANTFDDLRSTYGIKCSTNITPVISNMSDSYKTFKSGYDNGCFIRDNRAEYTAQDVAVGGSPNYYRGGVYYGDGRGTFGHYSDFGDKDVRLWWGQQYKMLMRRGLAMIWQDMTTPAIPETGHYTLNDREGDIKSDRRSFPFDLLLTDNFLKKYKDSGTSQASSARKLSPAGKIRNLYSYNLHKATYHGLNNIWYIHKFTFTSIVNTATDKAFFLSDSQSILDSLLGKQIVAKDALKDGEFYVVAPGIDLDDPTLDLGLDAKYLPYRAQIVDLLKESVDLEQKRRNKRNFIIGRGGFTGMHRFAGLWTGDNASTWDFLKINVAQILSLGLSGQAITGSDVGGFEASCPDEHWADPQLLIRWTILGAFLPWFRNHYIRKGSKKFQEPYKYQDYAFMIPQDYQYMYYSVLPVCRAYIQLRYRLLQLFYDALFEHTMTGMPIVRPLFLHDDHDEQLFNDKLPFLNNQFLVGKDLMVAPIMDKQNQANGNGTRKIYFPAGSNWYQFRHNRSPLAPPVVGGSTISYYAGLDARTADPHNDHIYYVLPLYVRDGAVIPTIELQSYVGQYLHTHGRPSPITLNIYPTQRVFSADEVNYILYIDDGESRDSAPAGAVNLGFDPEAKGCYRQVDINHHYIDPQLKTRVITIDRSQHDGFDPGKIYNFDNYYFVAILHDPQETFAGRKGSLKEVSVNGVSIDFDADADSDQPASIAAFNDSPVDKWYFNSDLNISFIKVFDAAAKLTLTLAYN